MAESSDAEGAIAFEADNELDVRGVSVVWNAENGDMPDVTYHGCASPFEAIGLLLVGALNMTQEWAIPDDDCDEDEDA